MTPVARRRPWVLARQVTTVDHLSRDAPSSVSVSACRRTSSTLSFGESADPRDHARAPRRGTGCHRRPVARAAVSTHDGPAHHLAGVRFAPVARCSGRGCPVWSACSLPARAGVRRAARGTASCRSTRRRPSSARRTPEEVGRDRRRDRRGRDPRRLRRRRRGLVAPDADRGAPPTATPGRRGSSRARRRATTGSTTAMAIATAVRRGSGAARLRHGPGPTSPVAGSTPDVDTHVARHWCAPRARGEHRAVDAANSRLGDVVSEAALRPPA